MFKLIVAYLIVCIGLSIGVKNDSRRETLRERRISDNNSDNLLRKEIIKHVVDRATNNSSAFIPPHKEIGGSNNSPDIVCGGDISLIISEEITSPMYPLKYPSDLDCRWRISAQNGQTIKVQIIKLTLEKDKSCKFDYLEIVGVRKLCGKISDKEYSVNASQVEIRFHSDSNNEETGFLMRIITESRDCVQHVNVTNRAFVTSPKYPSNYADESSCWTLITADKGLTLSLTFDVLQMEPDKHCAYDYVEVFDSKNASNSLGKFCEKPDNVTLTLLSTYNAFLLHFHSDKLLNSKGFRAEVSTTTPNSNFECEWKVNWNTMTITSPQFPKNYPPNTKCDLVISSQSPDQQVILLFDWLQMEVDAECSADRLEIWDDSSEKPSRLLCGRKLQPFKYVSRGRNLKLKFVSDDFAEFAGFRAKIQFESKKEKSSTASSQPSSQSLNKYQPLKNASVIPGSSHTLTCNRSSNTHPVLWYKDDQLIREGVSPDGYTLIIREFSARSEGRYICKFGNEYREAWLTLRDTKCPTVVFRRRPKDQFISEGDLFIMECSASDSKHDIRWEKDGKQLKNNSRVSQLLNGYLIFNGAVKQDSGIYYCVIKSSRECELKSAVFVSVYVRADINAICGKASVMPKLTDNGKIVGGNDAPRNAYPWHVMFWDYKRRSFCGGALLNERWVVTASHCFEKGDISTIEVRLGKYDQSITEESEAVTKIAEIIRHPDFSRDTFDNDIALVRLTQHVSFSQQIMPICITSKRDRSEVNDFFYNSDGQLRLGHVTGWGQLKENGPQPRFLQELRVPIVEDKLCRSSTAFKVTTNMFCAGYGKEVIGDACKGDSGGPFVVTYKSRWLLLGVVSWGEGCGRNGKFGFYTRINNYLDWINAIIKL